MSQKVRNTYGTPSITLKSICDIPRTLGYSFRFAFHANQIIIIIKIIIIIVIVVVVVVKIIIIVVVVVIVAIVIILIIQSSLVAPTVPSTNIDSDFTLIYGLIRHRCAKPHCHSEENGSNRNDATTVRTFWLTVRQLGRVLASAGCLQPRPGFSKSLRKVIIH